MVLRVWGSKGLGPGFRGFTWQKGVEEGLGVGGSGIFFAVRGAKRLALSN